ncbi:DUF4037 domain-containing protein [Oscillatoria salina]|uniref:DUF4037 domain-containing protein n=1 Tax=Oscillatoria salina TaxID=331517 RepID=UPI0013BAAC87|nr:DUF4037 domain-containing protein [Oscillatoria salina]MBZ8179718.1 DUF4037 domain-containing protein [Oscillatoria salina IIICB1]NET87180.1 DUF4037 domain-containing protein [Kamptonema sp. SIO1D9]
MFSQYFMGNPSIPPLAEQVAAEFAVLPQVVAIAWAGSRTNQASDEQSDYDFYVYIEEDIPIEIRTAIAKKFAQKIEINNQFWETGDEWIVTELGIGVDIMYRNPQWIEGEIDRTLIHHQASVGYSTCLWWNVLTSVSLFDRNGWFKKLQEKSKQPYPESLKKAIIAKNYPILKQNISSYTHQLQLAVSRQDRISVLHRTTALLASYFDIIFALNSIPHPGEKRILKKVLTLCDKVPENLAEQINNIINSLNSESQSVLLNNINLLVNNLEQLLIAEGLYSNPR